MSLIAQGFLSSDFYFYVADALFLLTLAAFAVFVVWMVKLGIDILRS